MIYPCVDTDAPFGRHCECEVLRVSEFDGRVHDLRLGQRYRSKLTGDVSPEGEVTRGYSHMPRSTLRHPRSEQQGSTLPTLASRYIL
jgi:hypothetical protein